MSIRFRLTLWYVGVLAAILGLFSGVVYVVLGRNLVAEVDRGLAERADQVVASIMARNDPLSVVRTGLIDLPELDVFSAPSTYLQVMRSDGTIAAHSPNLGNQQLPWDADVMALNTQGRIARKMVYLPSGVRLRIHSVPILVDGRLAGAVLVGQSLNSIDGALQHVLTLLVIGTLLALVAAGAGGLLLARLALRPIDRVAAAAASISRTQDLGQRLPAPRTEDELGRLVATFNSMLERLDQLFQAQQRLSADVSHELRTPLTTILGNVDWLRHGAADNPAERAAALDAIEGDVERMNRLVADLLLMAQADAGMQLKMVPVELDTLLLEVFRQARTIAAGRARGQPVNVRLGHEDQAVVEGDPDRLRQLLLNLVDNALKYSPPGGTVTLSLFREQDGVRVCVQDSGPGIPPEVLPHIFERFYRGPQQEEHKGAGLGLAIARWIAEAHGGRLTAESSPGQGSTFTLWLPCTSMGQPEPQPLD